jgi:hypothetical protein
MNIQTVLTDLGAAAGIAVLLIMAVTPLLVDLHRPWKRAPARTGVAHPVGRRL